MYAVNPSGYSLLIPSFIILIIIYIESYHINSNPAKTWKIVNVSG